MKYFPVRVLLILVTLTPTVAPAELVLYKGTRKDTFTGEGHGVAVTSKLILIVDHGNALAAVLQYGTINGVKRYSTTEITNIHFVEITGIRRTSTAITRIPSACETESGATGEAIYFHGANALLALNTNSTVTFPKILKDRGNALSFSRITGQPIFNEGSLQLSFDRRATWTSNQAGETLPAALARLTAEIESLGHTR